MLIFGDDTEGLQRIPSYENQSTHIASCLNNFCANSELTRISSRAMYSTEQWVSAI
jgi:hypothetical protein